MKRKILTFLAIALIVLLFSPCIMEIYLRCSSTYSPPLEYVFDKKVGFVFDHAAAPNVVNTFGFVDKQRSVESKDKLRIIIVGDSFVSGTSLADDLEKDINTKLHTTRFEVIPMGFPGIGLGNMYSFVAQYGSQFHPVAVIAVFNSSTFANDSSILEAIKLRFHPDHPAQLFFDGTNGKCSKISIDENYKKYMLKELPSIRPKSIYTVMEDVFEKIFGHFYVFHWLKDIVSQSDQKSFLREDKEFAYRYYQLASVPKFAKLLEGWNFPEDLDVNSMFWVAAEKMPPVFVGALEDTKCALQAFNDLGDKDKFKFILAISDDCTVPNELIMREFKFRSHYSKREFVEQSYAKKIISLAKDSNVQYVNIYDYFRGNSLSFHHFNDIHWNVKGFKAAAGAISEALLPELEKKLTPGSLSDSAQ